jgi:hypothetical protein
MNYIIQLIGSSICPRGEKLLYTIETKTEYVRFEVFTAVTMKNGVFWDVTPCGPCNN